MNETRTMLAQKPNLLLFLDKKLLLWSNVTGFELGTSYNLLVCHGASILGFVDVSRLITDWARLWLFYCEIEFLLLQLAELSVMITTTMLALFNVSDGDWPGVCDNMNPSRVFSFFQEVLERIPVCSSNLCLSTNLFRGQMHTDEWDIFLICL